ncbi:MAG: SurA N-terminal domain-containing protein, partial [Pseudomonadota bacterium]
MLNTIREKTQGIIATFILVLLVIPFALWGINSYFEGGPSNTVAKVDGTEISKQRYLEALERYRGRVEPGRFESSAFKELVLSGLIDQALMLQDVNDAGYRVSDQQLTRLVHEIPVFQRNGRFDMTMFTQFLRREGLSEQAFLAQLRADITTRQAQSGLVQTAIVTDAEVNRLAQLLAQRREAGWLRIAPEPLAARARVTP